MARAINNIKVNSNKARRTQTVRMGIAEDVTAVFGAPTLKKGTPIDLGKGEGIAGDPSVLMSIVESEGPEIIELIDDEMEVTENFMDQNEAGFGGDPDPEDPKNKKRRSSDIQMTTVVEEEKQNENMIVD